MCTVQALIRKFDDDGSLWILLSLMLSLESLRIPQRVAQYIYILIYIFIQAFLCDYFINTSKYFAYLRVRLDVISQGIYYIFSTYRQLLFEQRYLPVYELHIIEDSAHFIFLLCLSNWCVWGILYVTWFAVKYCKRYLQFVLKTLQNPVKFSFIETIFWIKTTSITLYYFRDVETWT